MAQPPVPFAPETLETIQRAFRLATERRHDTVSLEHLLRAITDEQYGRHVLAMCGVDLEALRRQVDEVLARAFTPVPPPGPGRGPAHAASRHRTRDEGAADARASRRR